MRDYVILTDSCCDLSAEMAAELGVEVLPLSLQMGDRTYRNYLDGREIGFHEFYERVRSGELATTSAVNVGEFEEKMREILKTGKDILSISFSSALSTTYQSSVIAAEELKDEFPDAKILTVDSLCASLGQGLFVYLCAQEQKKGKTIDEVKTFAEETKGRVCHWFTVDDLMYLKRGGRISATTAVLGTVMQIKPVMHTDDAGTLRYYTYTVTETWMMFGKGDVVQCATSAGADATEGCKTPADAGYSVSVSYAADPNNTTGDVNKEYVATVTNAVPLPETGGQGTQWFMLFGLLLLGLGTAWYFKANAGGAPGPSGSSRKRGRHADS